MKKITTMALCFCAVLFCANTLLAQDEPEFKSYSLISGYVEYKLSGTTTGTQEFYFEEYGKYDAKYSKGSYDYMGQKGTFNQAVIMNPDGVFQINLDKSQGVKFPPVDLTKSIETFEAQGGDFEKTQAQIMKDQGFIKTGSEKFLDRDCDIWELSKNGATVKVWYWKGMELKTVQSSEGMTATIEAVKIIEEEAIPFSKFEVPAGITWLDPKTGQPIKEEKK